MTKSPTPRYRTKGVKGSTKSYGQKDPLDKFYTKKEVAKGLIAKLKIEEYSTIIEPAAGNGSFSSQIPGCLAFDLKPDSAGIKQQDWLSYKHSKNKNEKVLVIGNPPFGQQNTLALSFLNHSAEFADTIAFILPISFKKESVQNKVNPYFHLISETLIPQNSFMLNGVDYDVKCVFQVWQRKESPRKTKFSKSDRANLNTNNLFSYVKKSESPDFSIQRVGGSAGKASIDFKARSESSNYFVKLNKKVAVKEVIAIIDKLFSPTFKP
jgi:hypothetical protein